MEVDFFINLHMLASEYKTLPNDGGLFDQDDYIIYGLSAVVQSIAEYEHRENEKTKNKSGKRK